MSVSKPNKMADLVGPFYRPGTVAARLGCHVEDLAEHEAAGGLLGLLTSDNVKVYPVFQFTENGTVRPELVPMLSTFTGIDSWSVAVWLRGPNIDLNGRSPEQALADDTEADLVRTLAGQEVGRLSA